MPQLIIVTGDGEKVVDVPADKKLVQAIADAGIDIAHRCGGFAKCTTCRVSFEEGEPEKMTVAEKEKLDSKGEEMVGYRLSCQLCCDSDMKVKPEILVSEAPFDDPGKVPEEKITPDPEWI